MRTALVYRFGDFTLACDTRQLLRGSEEVHVSPKAFDLLSVLLANRHRAVPKAELQDHVWPSTYVEETSLARVILEVRRALGDSAERPHLVRTVYGFGYRFVGHATVDGDSDPDAHRPCVNVDDRQWPLMDGANVLGRDRDVAVRVDGPGVSRRHACITVSPGAATVEDLSSKNGTFVNDTAVREPRPLRNGDRIRLGGAVVTFEIASESSATETLPGPQTRKAPTS
jgi:DNA-binding winged helix-turn-helix (wHTH) protein